MGKRLTRIYTRTGDDGSTGLTDGSRVRKDSERIAAIGDIDELNSALGVVLAEELPADIRDVLTTVQHDLFDLGGELSVPGHGIVSERYVSRLERELDEINARLAPLVDFILPGGTRAAAAAHVARATCRRAERTLVTLSEVESVPPLLLQYLNRLSDLLFVICRGINAAADRSDVLWQQGRSRES